MTLYKTSQYKIEKFLAIACHSYGFDEYEINKNGRLCFSGMDTSNGIDNADSNSSWSIWRCSAHSYQNTFH